MWQSTRNSPRVPAENFANPVPPLGAVADSFVRTCAFRSVCSCSACVQRAAGPGPDYGSALFRETPYRLVPAQSEVAQILSQRAFGASLAHTLPQWGDGSAVASMLDRKLPELRAKTPKTQRSPQFRPLELILLNPPTCQPATAVRQAPRAIHPVISGTSACRRAMSWRTVTRCQSAIRPVRTLAAKGSRMPAPRLSRSRFSGCIAAPPKRSMA